MKLNDPTLDTSVPSNRDTWLLAAIREQIAFMRARVPFWHERLSKAGVDEQQFQSLADLARIPILSKEEFRSLKPSELLPKESLSNLKICRWTSGTTGQPTVNFWSDRDWSALVASASRTLQRQAPLRHPVAFNAFSQGHVTGPLFNAALRRLGSVVYDRSHHPEDVFSTKAQTELFDFDTLIIPGQTTRGKGVGLANLLDEDAGFIERHKLRWWLGSAGTFDPELVNRAKQQGIQAVSNLYGSSEFAPFGLSCLDNPCDYHIAQGHILAEVVDTAGNPVKSGEFGRIVVTHLCGMDESGKAVEYEGTQILRLAAGDGATLLDEPCSCGLTTPRFRDVQRIKSN